MSTPLSAQGERAGGYHAASGRLLALESVIESFFHGDYMQAENEVCGRPLVRRPYLLPAYSYDLSIVGPD